MEEATVVALAATGVTALSVAFNGWMTWWTTRNNRSAQRAERAEQRKAEAYVGVLEHAEDHGRYMSVVLHNWEASVGDVHGVAVHRTAHRPEKDERNTRKAQVAAFASRDVKQAHASWLLAYDNVVTALENLNWNYGENYGPGNPIVEDEVLDLRYSVRAEEKRRQELSDAIGRDLNGSES